ncbi:hypothetical protein QOY_3416 [Clostridioides difficile Y231]|nr:hypothetical protein QOY_3416 [Clostridioides difficile Y231]
MIHSHFGAAAQHTNLCKAQPVKRIEQEPAALGLGTGVQNSHQLMQRFHAAKVFLRRFAVDPYTLGGNDVLVKLPAIPMPPLFMEQVLRFMIGPVKKFIDFQRNLHGHSLSVIIDGNFHLSFLHSDFFGKSEWGGGERHWGQGSGHAGPMFRLHRDKKAPGRHKAIRA